MYSGKDVRSRAGGGWEAGIRERNRERRRDCWKLSRFGVEVELGKRSRKFSRRGRFP